MLKIKPTPHSFPPHPRTLRERSTWQHSNTRATTPAPTLYFKQDPLENPCAPWGLRSPETQSTCPVHITGVSSRVFLGLILVPLHLSPQTLGFRSKYRIHYLKFLPTDKGPSPLVPSVFPDSVSTARHSLPHTYLLMPKLHAQIQVTMGERINVLVGFRKTKFFKKKR